MEITINARHMEMKDSLKARLMERFENVAADYKKSESLQIILHQEGKEFICEAHLRGKMLTIEAKGKGASELCAADDAYHKVVRQLHKFLEKKHEEPHRVKSVD